MVTAGKACSCVLHTFPFMVVETAFGCGALLGMMLGRLVSYRVTTSYRVVVSRETADRLRWNHQKPEKRFVLRHSQTADCSLLLGRPWRKPACRAFPCSSLVISANKSYALLLQLGFGGFPMIHCTCSPLQSLICCTHLAKGSHHTVS